VEVADFIQLEYIYKRPKFLMTCFFGIIFIIFGNLAGNAIQFGIFITQAIHPDCKNDSCLNKTAVLGWAVGVLTLCSLINISTRKFSIGLNNLLGTLKVLLLFVMVFLGSIYGTIHGDGCRQITFQNRGGSGHFGDIILALFYAMYPYTGYEQPFYVLAEVSRPKRTFAKATSIAMLAVLILYPLVNVSYLCMTPYSGNNSLPPNMGIAFFERLSGTSDSILRFPPILFSIFIFGNILAQTYTATRVKQEIAKEAILPWSLFFAAGSNTLFARLTVFSTSRSYKPTISSISDIDDHVEQTPIAATFLHWVVEVILVVVVGAPLPLSQAYNFLTYMYTFVIVGVLGLFTAGGLLYLKLDSLVLGTDGRRWRNRSAWQPWLDPLPAVLAPAALALLLFGAFAPPTVKQPNSLAWWVGPTAGWLSGFLGVLWWLGLRFVQWKGRWELYTLRTPLIDIDREGNAIQRVELVEHRRIPVNSGN
jgi:amino acid transporter